MQSIVLYHWITTCSLIPNPLKWGYPVELLNLLTIQKNPSWFHLPGFTQSNFQPAQVRIPGRATSQNLYIKRPAKNIRSYISHPLSLPSGRNFNWPQYEIKNNLCAFASPNSAEVKRFEHTEPVLDKFPPSKYREMKCLKNQIINFECFQICMFDGFYLIFPHGFVLIKKIIIHSRKMFFIWKWCRNWLVMYSGA